jgi:hypothetical protein
MAARIKLAASKGCDAVDPNNVGMYLILIDAPPSPKQIKDFPHESMELQSSLID